ncbi:MAG: Uncharacterized protein CEO22_278 [Candidatus Berkelbacteria bacterium Gr01-1014_85]|uniref:POTRA domain-containing protein n=1 Tax=Candidatus Berkelbacteria bacterium Gr01-1014_85 TaxID=2017150 RepID=A0A554JCG6_9BACT|nr:MAG: Uncharacterized protein CEO22_278 [Candidatus Berkelbacteria bacterium Gr01-1014_85]
MRKKSLSSEPAWRQFLASFRPQPTGYDRPILRSGQFGSTERRARRDKRRLQWQQPLSLTTPEIKPDLGPRWWSRRGLLILVGLFSLMGLWLWLMYGAFWQVQTIIQPSGLAPELVQELERWRGTNIFKLPTATLEAKLLTLDSSLASVKLSKGLPQTLKLDLELRQPALIWRAGQTLYTLDQTGLAYRAAPTLIEDQLALAAELPAVLVSDRRNLPVELGKITVRSGFISFVNQLKTELASRGIEVKAVEIDETTFSIVVLTNQPYRLLFETTRPLSAQLTTLGKILETKPEIKEYLDLRVRGWVYYR